MKPFEDYPKYDRILRSGLFSVEAVDTKSYLSDVEISIVSSGNKYGLIYTEHLHETDTGKVHYFDYCICECIYDTIIQTLYGSHLPLFTVFINGKCGLLKIINISSQHNVFIYDEVAPCIYDAITWSNTFCGICYLYRGDKIAFYCPETGYTSAEYGGLYEEGTFILGYDDGPIRNIISVAESRIVLQENHSVEYSCSYRDGYVFFSFDLMDVTQNKDLKVDARLIFYNPEKNQVLKTKCYKSLKVIVEKICYKEKMVGFSFVQNEERTTIFAEDGEFSDKDAYKVASGSDALILP